MDTNVDVALSLKDLKVVIDSLEKFKENIPPNYPFSIEYVENLITYLHDQHDSGAPSPYFD